MFSRRRRRSDTKHYRICIFDCCSFRVPLSSMVWNFRCYEIRQISELYTIRTATAAHSRAINNIDLGGKLPRAKLVFASHQARLPIISVTPIYSVAQNQSHHAYLRYPHPTLPIRVALHCIPNQRRTATKFNYPARRPGSRQDSEDEQANSSYRRPKAESRH
jgi:hypothetical protein